MDAIQCLDISRRSCFETTFRSARNAAYVSSRIDSSGTRSSDDGWTVAIIHGAHFVSVIGRLLAHEHQRRVAGAFAEHDLRRVAIEFAAPAFRGGTGEDFELA